MTHPIPGNPVTTPYGKKGSWSCGFHTGVDIAAPKGTQIVAPIDGQIRHRSYGSALGYHQFAISPDPDQAFGDGEVFFAHTIDRLPDGVYVTIGEGIAHVGAEGNATGPHLHMEYHPEEKNSWGCDVCANPQIILDHQDNAATEEVEDMFMVASPNRPASLMAPGHFHVLDAEEYGAMIAAGIRTFTGNDREYDLIRQVALAGQTDTTAEEG